MPNTEAVPISGNRLFNYPSHCFLAARKKGKVLGRSPVVRIALISNSHTGNKRTMPKLFCIGNGFVLGGIVGIRNPCSVRIL
jgi:hypothetical protein